MKCYAEVILPLSVGASYTYEVPSEFVKGISIGCRVIVPFGSKKIYTALVVRLHHDVPRGFAVKTIIDQLDSSPIVLPRQLQLWKWMADYYLAHLGDVYRAALPTGLKLESESLVIPHADYESDTPFSTREQQLWNVLCNHSELRISELQKSLGVHQVMPALQDLLKRGAISMKEEVVRSYKPRLELRVRLVNESGFILDEHRVNELLDRLERTKKQQEVLMKYLELSGLSVCPCRRVLPVSKSVLQKEANATSALLNSMVDKKMLEYYTYEIGRLKVNAGETIPLRSLSLAQQNAFHSILQVFQKKEICLLHGVTSSGKTEVYMHLIDQALKAGKQVLYLLPEIALTTQLTERLAKVFGPKLGVYHSKYPDATRVEIWQKQLSARPFEIILGVRSSVFLPFQNLGLVIVDEEHEASYKQQDPAPRYHARSAALMLAANYGAKTLLGTATPSMESYYYAQNGRYGFVELNERYKGIELPDIQVIDILDQQKKKYMTGPFSAILLGYIRTALDRGEQVILFQNRRGFAPMIECKDCGWVPRCQHCDVSLNYHKRLRLLTCHYCGSTYQVPDRCPECHGTDLQTRGYGTERIEDLIQKLIPGVRVARMDQDTTRTRSAYERIIHDFQCGNTDILIGTQMVTKGLDFEHVSLVGILNADLSMNIPDFRAYERTFQMLSQVAGRAGRHDRRGLVVLQTRSVDNPVIRQVVSNDYGGLYKQQLAERELFHYPPFYRMITIYLKYREEAELDVIAHKVADALKSSMGNQRVLGPDSPVVPKVQNLYIRKLILKLEQNAPLAQVRETLRRLMAGVSRQYSSLQIYADVDPQ